MIRKKCAEWGDRLEVTLRGGVREGPQRRQHWICESDPSHKEGQGTAKRTESARLCGGEYLAYWQISWAGGEHLEKRWKWSVEASSPRSWGPQWEIHFMLRASEVKGHSSVFIHVRAALCLAVQLCLTFCDSTDCSPPGSSVHGDCPGKSTGVGCRALL